MNIITHRTDEYNEAEELEMVRKRLEGGDSKKMKMFTQLCEFEYGRWLLVNRGLNAYWANYLVNYEEVRREDAEMSKKPLHPFEKNMLEKSSGVLCSRERAALDIAIMQKLLKDNMTVASLPCAAFNDLLKLDLSKVNNVKLVGIDLDPAAIELSKKNATKLGKESVCSFEVRDAWALNVENSFDILHSNGLNMYVTNEPDLLALYTNFYKAVKPGGCLLVTSNVPPKDENDSFVWSVGVMEMMDLPNQALLFGEVIQVRQGIYCTKNQIIKQLNTVGFVDVEVSFDTRKMFLGFIAHKK